MMKRVKFCGVPPGIQFQYSERDYLKLWMNLAEDEDGRRFMFPSETEVEVREADLPASKNRDKP